MIYVLQNLKYTGADLKIKENVDINIGLETLYFPSVSHLVLLQQYYIFGNR